MSGRPLRDCRCTSSPSTKAIARKPSHLGSYTQAPPVGSALADFASWGGSGRRQGQGHELRDAIRRAGVLRPAGGRVRRLVPRHGALRRARPPGWAEELDALVTGARGLPPARTLDVACGTGFLTRHLPGRGDGRWTRAPRMLALARGRGCPASASSRATRSPCPFADGAFERVAAGHFYGHLEPPERARFLAEAERVGGELVITDSARRPDVPAERWDPRVLYDGSRHAVFKRWFTPAGLAARAGRRRGAPRGHVVRRRAARSEPRRIGARPGRRWRYDPRHGPRSRDGRGRGVPADDLLAAGGGPADDGRERRARHAALRARPCTR